MDMNEIRRLSGIEQVTEAAIPKDDKLIKSTLHDINALLVKNNAMDAASALQTSMKKFNKEIAAAVDSKNIPKNKIRASIVQFIRNQGIYRAALDNSVWDKFIKESVNESEDTGKALDKATAVAMELMGSNEPVDSKKMKSAMAEMRKAQAAHFKTSSVR